MNQNETKYENTKVSLTLIIVAIIVYIVIPIGLIYTMIEVYNTPITETGIFQSVAFKILFLFVLGFFLFFTLSAAIGSIIGVLKGKIFINKENRAIKKNNPYIYYRELPNNYGIGVATLLFDSKIENYKDIIAVILDLCARKYLSLIKEEDKYCIKILKGLDNTLLSNEKYILNLIISQDIKNINYNEWYDYCLQDGIKLDLYFHNENTKRRIGSGLVTKKETEHLKKMHRNISLFMGAFMFFTSLISGELVKGIFYSLSTFILFYLVLIIPFYIIFVGICIVNMFKMQKNTNYDIALNNHLTRTKKGVVELQKLISFQSFLSDFGNFVDKCPEEVVLWDRYLSYAQVFGLTKEIMKTGYNKLVDNSSFNIDNIDNITIDNIEVKK